MNLIQLYVVVVVLLLPWTVGAQQRGATIARHAPSSDVGTLSAGMHLNMSQNMQFKIAVKQLNGAEMQSMLISISTPGDPSYGKHKVS